MFNIHETSSDKQREEVLQHRLEILRRAYQDGFFQEEGTEPMSEVVSDGKPPMVTHQDWEDALGIGSAADWCKARDDLETLEYESSPFDETLRSARRQRRQTPQDRPHRAARSKSKRRREPPEQMSFW